MSNEKEVNLLSSKKILVVDDDAKIRELMERFLASNDAIVSAAASGSEMLEIMENNDFDLIILDIMLPDTDGFKLCKTIRDKGIFTPVIMLTAVAEDTDRILGLELGADDYLTKPFNVHELIARIKAILRRSDPQQIANMEDASMLSFQGWTLDKLKRRLVSPEGLDVMLTDGEYRLLEVLAENPKTILSRDHLLEIVEKRQAGPYDRSIDVRISRIRQKLRDDPKNPALIKTVRGGGYILMSDVESKK